MMAPLSPRLMKIFDCAEGTELWDIGCDHGLLAVYNVFAKKFQRVVCVDRSASIMQRLPQRFSKEYRLSPQQMESIHCLHEDGTKLNWATVQGTAVIAGVGSLTIISILESATNLHRERLSWVLVPQDGPEMISSKIRDWFSDQTEVHFFEVREGKRIKTIIQVKARRRSQDSE